MYKSSLITLFLLLLSSTPLWAAAYSYFDVDCTGKRSPMPVIGFMQSHQVRDGDTMLDIARDYGLGFNEIRLAYPEIDPWLPPGGRRLKIPTMWVLPSTRYEEVVVNLAEMRIYRFFKRYGMVKTYPIGIGRKGFETPLAVCFVVERQKNPSWTVPPAARHKFPRAVIPPGPQNPLGKYWLGLSAGNIGLHGTNFPWGVGRRVSHGCLRLYPEHISQLFEETPVGTRVEIVHEPVKIGIKQGRIYLEVHPDLYSPHRDLTRRVHGLIRQAGLMQAVVWEKVRRCIDKKNGLPVLVGRI